MLGTIVIEKRGQCMSTVIAGVVANGLVVPAEPLPEGAHVEIHVQTSQAKPPSETERLSPSQLRKLPRSERQAILEASAALAEEVYRDDKDLTGFDAFSEEMDDDSH